MHHHGNRHVRRRPYILPVFGLLIGGLIVVSIVLAKGGDTYGPSNSHVVFLFDRGKRTTLNTKAATVGDLVEKLPLKLIAEDVVEPSRDTPIVVDNFRINIYRARPVTVVDTASRTVILTAQQSPRVVAETAKLAVYAEDKVKFAPGDIDKNILGEQVVIDRATAVVLNLYGDSQTMRTRSTTVGELLKEKEIKMETGDSLQPGAETPLVANLQIFVSRMGVKITTVEESIPAPTQHVEDNRLTAGTTALRQKGTPGKKLVTYQIETTNGATTNRKVLQSVVAVQPVPRIIAVGSVAFSGSLQDWLYKLRMCETGGNYQANTGNSYYGAYQFLTSTWRSLNTGYDRADHAPPAVQDQAVIANTLRSSGGLATQHPGCYKKEGLSKFPPSNR